VGGSRIDRRRWLSVSQAAQAWGCSKRYIRKLVETGKVRATKRGGGKWWISIAGLKQRSDLLGIDAYIDAVEFAATRHHE
jgi:excisionase family DNA binding protein